MVGEYLPCHTSRVVFGAREGSLGGDRAVYGDGVVVEVGGRLEWMRALRYIARGVILGSGGRRVVGLW